MKTLLFLSFSLFSLITHAVSATPAPSNTVSLPAGTLVLLETTERVPSERATVGKTVQLRVRTDVVACGNVVIRTGAIAVGRIKHIRRSSYNLPEMLVIEATHVQAADGRLIALNGTEQSFEGQYPNESMIVEPGQTLSASVMNNETIQL